MIVDPVAALARAAQDAIQNRGELRAAASAELSPDVRWRPDVYEPTMQRAWHVMGAPPESDAWVRRIERARLIIPDLRVGICAPPSVLFREPAIISGVDQLDAAFMAAEETAEGFRVVGEYPSIADLIYERQLRLPDGLAAELLDRALERAKATRDSYAKGARLELLVALLLSQVIGFEVTDRNVLSATQEVDVHATNRNIGGPLGRGGYVIAEAKNWSQPVDRREYNAFANKVRTRRGMVKLGFMVTTNRFTKPCYLEHIGERHMDDLIVLLDERRLPSIWRDHASITEGVERMVMNAVYDHEVE